MIRLHQKAVFYGPNPFGKTQVIVCDLSIAGESSAHGERLVEACLLFHSMFPEWITDKPSQKMPIAETVARTAVQWALGVLNEVRGFLLDAGAAAKPEGAVLWIGFHIPEISRTALEYALGIIEKTGRAEASDRNGIDAWLEEFWMICKRHHPDYQARILMQGALAGNIPVLHFMRDTKYWQFGWGYRSRIFMESLSNSDSLTGFRILQSKVLQKAVYASLGFPSPRHVIACHINELPKAAETIGLPCVLKPLHEAQGRGVTVDIRTVQELKQAFIKAKHYAKDRPVLIEAFVQGKDYRITVINGKYFAATLRKPVTVIGNGTSTIRQLLDRVNQSRSTRNMIKRQYLMPVESTPLLEQHLAHQGVGLETVLETGKKIILKGNDNLSIGGISSDVTDRTHQHVRHMAEIISETIGVATLGIDYISADIENSWLDGGFIIETNAVPGLDIMISGGLDTVMVASAVLGPIPARIPFQIIIVKPSALAETQKFLQNLAFRDNAGWTCSGRTAMGKMQLHTEESTPWSGVVALLGNKNIEQVCVVCTLQEIFHSGMPVDRTDHLILCGDNLHVPNEWMQVFSEHCSLVEHATELRECAIAGLSGCHTGHQMEVTAG